MIDLGLFDFLDRIRKALSVVHRDSHDFNRKSWPPCLGKEVRPGYRLGRIRHLLVVQYIENALELFLHVRIGPLIFTIKRLVEFINGGVGAILVG